ncbi:MAG: hypothetical protein IKL78_04895 [Lachnospiraceae bacterium]|nr:hypothetical protein [Lachnospiraceae bacterium]
MMKIKNKERFWFFSFFVLIGILLVWRVPYGHGAQDEPFYLMLADRVVKGDALLSEEWHPTQFTGFLLAPIMAVYRLLVPTTEGILVNFRYIFVVFWMLMTLAMYGILKNYPKIRIPACFYFMLYIPASIMAMSYHTIGLSTMILTFLLLVTMKEFSKWRCLATGIIFAVSVLSVPHMTALYGIYSLVCFVAFVVSKIVSKKKNQNVIPDVSIRIKTWLFITLGCGIVAIIFAIFILSRATVAEILPNLKFILVDKWHQVGLVQKIKDYRSAMLFVYGPFIWIWSGIVAVALIDRGRWKRKWFYVLAMAISIGVNLIQQVGDLGGNFVMYPIVYMGLLCFVLQKDKNWKTFLFGYVGGVIYSFCKHWSSMLRMDAICMGSVLIGVFAILDIGKLLKESRAQTTILTRLGGCILGIFLIIQLGSQACLDMRYSFYMDTLWGENQVITEGPLKNVIMKKSMAGTEVLTLEDIKFIKGLEDKKIMFATKRNWLYLYADMEYGTPSAWIDSLDENYVLRVMDYFELHPDKKADYIYIGAGDGWDYSSVERIAPYYGYGKVTFTNRGCFLERTEY